MTPPNADRDTLRALAEAGVYCTIERDFEEENLSGYVVAVGDEYAAIESFSDFQSQGVSLTRIEDMLEARVGEGNRIGSAAHESHQESRR